MDKINKDILEVHTREIDALRKQILELQASLDLAVGYIETVEDDPEAIEILKKLGII